MRHTLAAHDSRALTGLCAACARKRISSSIASRAALATRTFSQNPQTLPRRNQPPVRAVPRRWLSTSNAPPLASPQPSLSEEQQPPTSPSAAAAAATDTPLSYYALFPRTLSTGAPPTGPFTIDTRALHREFLQLQAASHPDFHHNAAAGSSTLARRKAEAVSSHINTAYTTLASPLLRAQYLLATRYGRDLAGDEASELSGPADPEVLMVVLEARESIEEAATEGELEGVREENEARIAASLRALERAFVEEDVEAAVKETVRLRYWVNIRDSVKNWEAGKPVVLQH
ncbi:unnamed protein product [Discula destructiva]